MEWRAKFIIRSRVDGEVKETYGDGGKQRKPNKDDNWVRLQSSSSLGFTSLPLGPMMSIYPVGPELARSRTTQKNQLR